jgi:hypothetical protein
VPKKKPLTTRGARATRKRASVTEVAKTGTRPVIVVPPGGTLKVVVDVGPMTIPYAVAYAGNVFLTSLVDSAKDIAPLVPGDELLTWAFSHTEKGWEHAIGYSINEGEVVLLERKSEAKKDPDHSLGSAIVRV